MATIPGAVLLIARRPIAARRAFRRVSKALRQGRRARPGMEGLDAGDEPRLDRRIIAEAYEDDPESAKAEYGAEFRTDLADSSPARRWTR